jgi:hypothetical protein
MTIKVIQFFGMFATDSSIVLGCEEESRSTDVSDVLAQLELLCFEVTFILELSLDHHETCLH